MKYKNLTSFYVPLPSSTYNIIIITISSKHIDNHIKQCYNFASTMKHNFKNPIEGSSVVATHIFAYRGLFSSLMFQDSFFVISFLCKELALGLLVTNSLNFPTAENILVSPSFLKDMFTGHRIPSLLRALDKNVCHFLLASTVLDEKYAVV